MKRTFVFFLCFFSILFSSSYAHDGNRGLEVTCTQPGSLTTEPGRTITASFLVSNNTGWEESLTEIVRLPVGWQKILSDGFTTRLNPGEQGVRLVAFLVPEGSPAGLYHVVYTARSGWDYQKTASDSISVVVLSMAKFEIILEQKPKVVIAGEAYQVKLRLVDKGNYAKMVTLRAKSNPAYPVRIEPAQVSLHQGKPGGVTLEVETDKRLRRKTKNFLEIRVEAEDSVFARKNLLIDVVPRVGPAFDAYHKLPVQVGLTAAGRDRNHTLQAEISGRGSLDESGKTRVEFLFRGPDVQKVTRMGRRDEYWLSYRQRNLELYFGDRSYRLSPLTERSSYGRGAEAKIHTRKFGLGAFYLKSRWGTPKISKAGSYLEYEFAKGFSVKGNVLMKSKGGTTPSLGDDDEKIYSIQAKIAGAKALNLDLEFGFCEAEDKNKSSELAFRADLDGQLSNKIRYSLEKIYSDPEYFGYYKDIDYTSGTVTFPIYRTLGADFSYRSYRSNLDLDSTLGIANQEKSYQPGLFYTFPFGTRLSLKYKDLKRRDHVLPSDYDYQEKSLKLGAAQTLGKLSLSTYAERGQLEDRLLGTTDDNLERYSFYTSFRPDPGQSYSLFARVGHSSFTRHPEREKSLGISTRWHVVKSISLDMRYRKDIASSGKNRERDNLFSTLTYAPKNGHNLVLRTQWCRNQEKTKGEFSFLLMYTVPFKISVSKKKSVGALKGSVHDKERPENPGIPNVTLSANGKSATSDRNGEFSFSSLSPGTYYLRVQKNSIGLNRITTERMPLLAEVKGGKTTKVTIGVVTSCRLSGKVALFARGSDGNPGDEDTPIILGSKGPPQSKKEISPAEFKRPAPFTKLIKTREGVSVFPVVSFIIRCYKASGSGEYFSGKKVHLEPTPQGIVLSAAEEEKLEEEIERVVFIPRNEELCFSLNGKDYKGILEVIFASKDSSLLALNWLSEEDYLKSETLLETGNRVMSEFKALRTEVVAASSESRSLIEWGTEEKSEKDDLREEKGLSNTSVEISDGEEVLRRLTDEKGRFCFEEIRPGKWTLKIDPENLPPHHYLEKEEFQIELEPGQHKEITVEVLPRARPIQIIDEGKIESENK
jgi:hypothetical protein